MKKRRAAHAPLTMLLAAAAVLSGCSTPMQPPITGYTCCNLRAEHGWISSNNVQGGTLIPAGEPVQLTTIKKRYYVYGTVGGNEVAFRDDAAATEDDTLQWLRRITVAEDPRNRLEQWPDLTRLAVRAGRVSTGMTRDQVLMSLGLPSRNDTRDLDGPVWRYWTGLHEHPVDLHFGADSRLARIDGRPEVVRHIVFAP
ncbi:hypothetical protein [Aquabacterium humicola]|uniref:hypothetical protein n=1 Tax=Aquabacterium humicola TaxID=3237377 RepID=UPI0025439AF4|nr:hypothetical protein [Rubrivivax pictus]